MSSEQPPAGKAIGNVGILDIREAKEEALGGIGAIGNVGMILYSPATAGWVTRLKAGNVGCTLQVPAGASVMTGTETWSRTSIEGKEPLRLVVTGKLLLHPHVPRESLERNLESLAVVGEVTSPDHLAGVIRARARDVTGRLTAYPWVEGGLFFADKVTLDGSFLEDLEEGSDIVALGGVSAPEVLDDELLRSKVSSLYIGGRLHCREENLAVLRSRLHARSPSPRTTAVPAGFEAVEGRLRLDMAALGSLPGRRLYCTGLVEVAAEVEAGALEEGSTRFRRPGCSSPRPISRGPWPSAATSSRREPSSTKASCGTSRGRARERTSSFPPASSGWTARRPCWCAGTCGSPPTSTRGSWPTACTRSTTSAGSSAPRSRWGPCRLAWDWTRGS